MSEAIEVSAEVVGEDIVPVCTPAVIDARGYLADRRAKVAAYMEPYEGMTEEGLKTLDKRELYNLRADVNKVIKAMEAEVRAIKKEHMKPFDEFKKEADEVIFQAKNAHALLDGVFKDKEAQDRAIRRAELEDEYYGCAGILAEVIPFEAVLDEKWLGDTAWKNGKALNELVDKVSKANDGYQALKDKELAHKDEVVKFYCETLDLAKALQLEDELNEEDRQRAEFMERRRQAEAFAAERREQRAETEEEAFQEEPQRFVWSLSMEFEGTREEAESVARALKAEGITGAVIKCKGAANV